MRRGRGAATAAHRHGFVRKRVYQEGARVKKALNTIGQTRFGLVVKLGYIRRAHTQIPAVEC